MTGISWKVVMGVTVLAGNLAPVFAAEEPEASASQESAVQDPQQMIQNTLDQVLGKLTGHQEEMRSDPRKIYALVEKLILPHFDFERMSRWVLGKEWNSASPSQRTGFVEEFRTLLVRTYGVALLDYTEEKIQFLPSRGDPAKGEVVIRLAIKHRGNSISIDSNLYKRGTDWKVYDVVINGVSLVTNYRTSFATEIKNSGLDALIAHLAERNQGKGK
ncbi:phospholipid transport system substrate-binding protein [Gammaproteobacteria bacterium]